MANDNRVTLETEVNNAIDPQAGLDQKRAIASKTVTDQKRIIAPEIIIDQKGIIAPETITDQKGIVAPETITDQKGIVAPETIIDQKRIVAPETIINQKGIIAPKTVIDMNEMVGTHDILFLCFDCLRFDVALAQQENGGTPVLNRYGGWERRGASGNFTYPAHHAMFAGFLPTSLEPVARDERELLFFQNGRVGTGKKVPPRAFSFTEPTFIQGLERVGYETVCIGGVGFFAGRSALGRIFPAMFKHSFWNPSFGCTVKSSPDNQIKKAVSFLKDRPGEERVMMYINFDAIHYPNHFYLDKGKKDSIESHAAALRYIDRCLPELFAAFSNRGQTFVIACADHGTCYAEVDDGFSLHGFNHDSVNTVPYKHFCL